jgi:Flp pilus assembly pilin Flp
MPALFNRFWKDESGQGLTEYVLIIALIAVALIACLIVFRNQIGGVFNRASQKLNDAPGTGFPALSPT